jgi:hypothetical protein
VDPVDPDPQHCLKLNQKEWHVAAKPLTTHRHKEKHDEMCITLLSLSSPSMWMTVTTLLCELFFSPSVGTWK